MMQNLNDMLLFAEVVDSGSFAAAGRNLGVPKSTLSRRISELEARLGVRLLQRTTRQLSLTEAGSIYHGYCTAVRDEAQAAHEAVAMVQSEARGVVRVTCPINLAQTRLGPILPRFIAAHPHVRVEVTVTNRVVDLIHDGVDVALRVRFDADDTGSLVVKKLGNADNSLLVSRQLLERLGSPQTFADLQRLPTVAMNAVDGRACWRLQGPDGESVEFHHQPIYTADDLSLLKFAVLDGIGMAIMPDYMCIDERRNGVLVPALPGWGPPIPKVLAVFPSRRGMVPAVRRFLDFLGEHM